MEEELKVGEYVRTKRGIAKVLEVKTVQSKMYGKYNKAFLIDKCPRMYITETEFIKHSNNIIDLIECGDIIEINKEKYEIIYDKSFDKLGVLIPNKEHLAIRHSALEHIFKEYENIKILTHEQFEQNSYKV